MRLYDENGYFDFPAARKRGYPFNIATGPRGTGKTYGALKDLTETRTEFIFMRTTKTQLDEIMTEEMSPYRKLNKELGWHVEADKITKNSGAFWWREQRGEDLVRVGDPLGIALALSTVANIRGFGSTADVLIYDEFIREEHERPLKRQANAFFNAYETINRNRELEGYDPLQAFLFSNSNTLDNDIFIELGIVDIVAKMTRTGKTWWTDERRGLCVMLLNDSPISVLKRDTALYRLTAGTDYSAMAIDNQWAFDESDGTTSHPLIEYRPIVTVGMITIYRHKGDGPVYVSTHRTGSPPVYGAGPSELSRFRRAYGWIWAEYMARNIDFESRQAEILLTKYLH